MSSTRRRPKGEVVLFAPLGSNPAHLIATTWALRTARDLRVRSAWLVLFDRGARYLHEEMLAPGAALDALHESVGRTTMPREHINARVPSTDAALPLADDVTADDASTFYDAVVTQAQAAIEDAGSFPVVFALLGGSRRTLTVAATVVAQLLARPQDLLVDVRYTPKRVLERAGRFQFPEQPDQRPLRVDGHLVRPRDVKVNLVDVPVPRIGGLVSIRRGATYVEMLAAGQASIDAAALPELKLDLTSSSPSARLVWPASGRVEVLKCPRSHLLHLGALALAASRGDGWLRPVAVDDDASSHPFVELVMRCSWAPYVRLKAVHILREEDVERRDADDLESSMTKLRTDVGNTLRKHARRLGVPEKRVAPEKQRRIVDDVAVWDQRLPLRCRLR